MTIYLPYYRPSSGEVLAHCFGPKRNNLSSEILGCILLWLWLLKKKRDTAKSVWCMCSCFYMYLFLCCLSGAHLHTYCSPSQRLPHTHIIHKKLQRTQGTTPFRSDTSFEEDEGYSHLKYQPHPNPLQYQDVVGQSLPDTCYHLYFGWGDIPLVGPRNKELRPK